MKFLHEHGVVILSGREGTGKYKMCLEIASLCEKLVTAVVFSGYSGFLHQ
jgi:hypothetical protein